MQRIDFRRKAIIHYKLYIIHYKLLCDTYGKTATTCCVEF